MYNLAGVFHLCLFISLTGYGSIKTKLLRVRSTLNISVIAQRCFLKCLDLNFSDKGDVCGGIRTIGSDIQQPIHFFFNLVKKHLAFFPFRTGTTVSSCLSILKMFKFIIRLRDFLSKVDVSCTHSSLFSPAFSPDNVKVVWQKGLSQPFSILHHQLSS